MPLFGRKKQEKEVTKLPSFESLSHKNFEESLPKIKFSDDKLEFPNYKEDLENIKKVVDDENKEYSPLFEKKRYNGDLKEVKKPIMEELEVPERVFIKRPVQEPVKMINKPIERPIKLIKKPIILEKPKLREQIREEISFERDKPIFVKLDQYKKMIETVDEIKVKLEESSKLLNEIKGIKLEEDHLLEIWHNNIEKVKSDLLRIDKRVFEE